MELLAQGTEILPPLDPHRKSEEFAALATAALVHDLGNLIQIATSAINIVTRTPEMPDSHAGPMLNRARTALDHASAIVRQNAGRLRERNAAPHCEVERCLADVAMLAGTDAPELAIEIVLQSGLPALACDPLGLQRAMLNLVLNARDAMGGDGLVQIAARALPGAVELCVRDRGTGMSPATIARAFDPFFTTRPDGSGGIGLSMVERFVRNAGGSIAIESAPGIGTSVMLRLPAHCRPQNLAEETPS